MREGQWIIWSGRDVEVWSPDEDDDYRFVIRGAASRWVPRREMRELFQALAANLIGLE